MESRACARHGSGQIKARGRLQRDVFGPAERRYSAGRYRPVRQSRHAVAVAEIVRHRRASLRDAGSAGGGRAGRYEEPVRRRNDSAGLCDHRPSHESLHHLGHRPVHLLQQALHEKALVRLRQRQGRGGLRRSCHDGDVHRPCQRVHRQLSRRLYFLERPVHLLRRLDAAAGRGGVGGRDGAVCISGGEKAYHMG